MANVQVANTVPYTSVPTPLIPKSLLNLALLPNVDSNAPFKAYVPVSMANNLGINQSQQLSPWQQYAASAAKASSQNEECVTKIILSNFDGPINITCTDVTPRTQLPPVQPPPMQPPCNTFQPQMFCPRPFEKTRPYYPCSYEREPCKPRRSHSYKKPSKKRSKSPAKSKSKQREHTKAPAKDAKKSKKAKSASRSSTPSSPKPKFPKETAPRPPSLAPSTLPNLPPPPTAEQLQSAVLRPVQPRPKPYIIETAQTLPMPVEPEKVVKVEKERSRSPDPRKHPCHCMPMVYCMPTYPMPYHQPRIPKNDLRMQRLLDICDGKIPLKVKVLREPVKTKKSRSQSLPRPKSSKDWKVRQQAFDQPKRPGLQSILTPSPQREVSPLRSVIRPSPPPQQPLHSQGLFGMRKGQQAKITPVSHEDVAEGYRGLKPPSPRGASSVPPAPPLPPNLPGGSHGTASPAAPPKLCPKPNIQWPPQIRPGNSEKPTTPPRIEFGQARQPMSPQQRTSMSTDSRGEAKEGSYEVIWDYFSENGEETDEEFDGRRVNEIEETDEDEDGGMQQGLDANIGSAQWRSSRGNYNRHQRHQSMAPRNYEVRGGRMLQGSSASYYNIDSRSTPKVTVKVRRDSSQ